MYRVIASSKLHSADAISAKIWDFLSEADREAKFKDCDIYYITKSFKRKLNGKEYLFKLQKGRLVVTCGDEKLGVINPYGFNNIETKRLAEKVIEHSQS